MAKPKCKLTETNGNVYAIIGKVSATLKETGKPDIADEFKTKAMQASSYDKVLQLCFKYVDVV